MKTGRNEPCPCGSGKKYKVCCGQVKSSEPIIRSEVMTKPPKSDEENRETNYANHIVCSIDLLNQKESLERLAKLPIEEEPTEEFLAAERDTSGLLLELRRIFDNSFDRPKQCTIPADIAALPKVMQEKYWRFKDCVVRVERFSDTFIFTSRIPNKYGDISVTALYGIIFTCCKAMIMTLAAGKPVRGAITIGSGAVLEDDSFYGPALAEAHYLESKVAGYPRIIISRNRSQYL